MIKDGRKMRLGESLMRKGNEFMRRCSGSVVRILLATAVLTAPALAFDRRDEPDGMAVDHQGVYLAQQIGRCMNGTGRCYFGGQCPGGEYSPNLYNNGRVYCRNFYPPAPYPPTLVEQLLGAR
jgi:hypothetical protein